MKIDNFHLFTACVVTYKCVPICINNSMTQYTRLGTSSRHRLGEIGSKALARQVQNIQTLQ